MSTGKPCGSTGRAARPREENEQSHPERSEGSVLIATSILVIARDSFPSTLLKGQNDAVSRLLPLPSNTIFGVFQDDAGGSELVADLVGAGEVARLARCLALRDQAFNLGIAQLHRF